MSKHAEFLINDRNKNKSPLHKGVLSKHGYYSWERLFPFLVESKNDECISLSRITGNSIVLIGDIFMCRVTGYIRFRVSELSPKIF